jgi:hypothetical protein
VQHRIAAATVRCGDSFREEHRVLVGKQAKVGVELRLVAVLHRPEPTPVGEVVGDREREPRTERAVGDVGHHGQAETRDVRRPGILDTGVVGTSLPARVGCEHDAFSGHPDRHALAQLDLGKPDA